MKKRKDQTTQEFVKERRHTWVLLQEKLAKSQNKKKNKACRRHRRLWDRSSFVDTLNPRVYSTTKYPYNQLITKRDK